MFSNCYSQNRKWKQIIKRRDFNRKNSLIYQAALWDNVDLLLDLLQEDHDINCVDSWGRTPLHAAAVSSNSKCLQVLINAGADINKQCGLRGENKTALHLCAELGYETNVATLLNAQASFTIRDMNDLTALDLARRNGHGDCEKTLQAAIDSREQVRLMKHNELREAVNGNEETRTRVLLDAIGAEREIIVNMAPSGQNTLLFLASSLGSEKIVDLLFDAGADGRSHPVTNYSPLYISCHNGHLNVSKLILKRFPELVHQLTVEKWLPFHAAVINGHVAIVELLIKFNYPENVMINFRDPLGELHWHLPFDPNAQDVTSQSALYVACLLGNKGLVELLLKWKVKCTKIKNELDESPEKRKSPAQVLSPLSPSGRRVSLGIMSIMSRLSLGREQNEEETSTDHFHNPIDVNLPCGAARETALLASVRGGFCDVSHILLQHKADPNIIARPLEDPQNDPRLVDEIYGFCNTPLAEATRQKSISMVDLLLKYGAKDDESNALAIAIQNNDEQITCRLLAIKAHSDPDYKINKKAITTPDTEFRPLLGNLTFSSLFPNTPTMINWHSHNFRLTTLKTNWLVEAALYCNAKLKGHPKSHQVSLSAITRIDVSHNSLTEVPNELLTLISLRYLNLSQNKLNFVPVEDVTTPVKTKRDKKFEYNVPVLEELYLQDNRLESIPSSLFRLPSLHILDISNNKLQELPFDLWKSPKLRELNVAFNLLKDLPSLPPEELCCNSSDALSPVADAYLFNNLGYDEKGFTTRNTVSKNELMRHNVWSKSLEVTDQELRLSDAKNDQSVSQLSSLNLANNLFTSIPLALPCLAVNLTRLNLSYNSLRSMGHITSYPSSLKQLDLGHNEISCWPSLPRIAASDPHLASDNLLTRIQLSTDDVSTLGESDEFEWSVVGVAKSRLIFPNLSMLDISNNCLKEIPTTIHELTNLSVLNISGNADVNELPPHMGLLSRLWNLNTRGCSLQEPLRSMIDSKKYKTMDIIGYLKSVFEDARKYARMKLMVVGIQRIGKTSLLEMLRNESGGNKNQRKQVDHWAKRMGHKNIINTKTTRGNNISTVGVDIGDWICDKRRSSGHNHGPVVFRTWDFGGQKEYYATHQYFLSKRSLYLVLWRIIDGKKGLAEVLQWLGNIQARAPNSPCIIVGTHYDEVGEKFPPKKAEELQQIIRDRFIAIADAEKMGLPRVLDSIEVSCKTGHNIKLLANLIYDTAFSLRLPGSKDYLLQQRVPASYLTLEDVVGTIAYQLRQNGVDPVLNADNYREMVAQEMQNRGHKGFRDNSELNQATMFLHDNGVLLHYDDATLRDLYFLDPQWLCDMLAHVVTVREINPFARTGVMKIDDLQHLFKSSCLGPTSDNRSYIVSLLNKFEVALTWDSRTLLIPSLLPTEDESLCGKAVTVKIVARSRGWAMRSKKSLPIGGPLEEKREQADEVNYEIYPVARPDKSLSRLLLMSYFPSGFWSRLITRILADDQVVDALRCIYPLTREAATNPNLNIALNQSVSFYWSIWQTGLALFYGNIQIFKMREIPFTCQLSPYRNQNNRFKLKQEGLWCDIDLMSQSIMELTFPMHAIGVKPSNVDLGIEMEIEINIQSVTQLLALIVDHIDLLLEDWYPTLGTRFVHTSEGKFLVTRLVPCQKCLLRCEERSNQPPPSSSSKLSKAAIFKRLSLDRNRDGELSGLNEFSGILNEMAAVGTSRKSQDSLQGYSDCDSGVDPNSACSSRTTSVEGHPLIGTDSLPPPSYSWMVEECILAAYDKKSIQCPVHGEIDLSSITPDVNFLDLSDANLIKPEDISRGQLLGRGAFGFVFKATYKMRGSNRHLVPVAMKMLQPVAPGPRANQSAIIAYKAALGKWERDPLQHSCKAYCTARQELSVLLTLRHPNIVPLIGVCTQPLALVLDLAPKGGLDVTLRHYRRNGARIGPYCFQSLTLQTARALEYLHRRRVIYRDLKSENILVFEFPDPHTEDHPGNSVHIKMADYGISRIVLPSGSKGFGGTEGFMAPEIMKHNGEEEYTEKVDCFSFGMFLYELISLRQPFEGHEAVKECILDGNRPVLTQRETQFPTYCLDLMVLAWDQNPKVRPTASQIVSIGSAPEFTHLLDVVSLSHPGSVLQGLSYPISGLDQVEEKSLGFELWLPCSNSRIDLLLCSSKGWQQYHKILCPQLFTSIQQQQMILNKNVGGMKLTCCCIVDSNIWIGDSDGNIHAFNASDCSHLFSYSLEIAENCSVVTLMSLDKYNRVAAGLSNGRLFLLDSTLIPKTFASAEGSFVLTELGSGEQLFSACCVWNEIGTYEIWCGETDGVVNVFCVNESGVSDHHPLTHFEASLPSKGLYVAKLYATTQHVFSYVAPSCILYQWNSREKVIENKLDCSKLIPCSESLKSIQIDEHLSPGKCQISSLAVLRNELYIGTTWGCLIIVEKHSLRPITVFRPFEEDLLTIIPLPMISESDPPLIVTIGKSYRSLIDRYTDVKTVNVTTPNISASNSTIADKHAKEFLQRSRSNNMHALLWRADHWTQF
ncbi:CLUMA_CG003464, isoform A [Clunio marinus]|uniref:non-specific serine/threonine protein kinase n=1 Tax=Clunio marinus TaxID=568069 RepID=A0A1J1HTA3_9DIPT|nr:CLUMA_CG003464, isoform A [Clunio marinus]